MPLRHRLPASAKRFTLISALVVGLAGCSGKPPPPLPEGYGIASRDSNVLSRPRPGLTPEQRLEWSVGRSFAVQPWVAPPSTTTARDGLGPLFNANSCAACHRHNGQGQLPEQGPGMILVLRSPAATPDTNLNLGDQLQDRALPGWPAEGEIHWRVQGVTVGEQSLEAKHYFITQHPQRPVSARLAPALVGMGLLDHVSDDTLIAMSDPDDTDEDGISGRVNTVWDVQQKRFRPGRFGWKASQPSLRQQSALAFAQDIGVRSSLYPHPLCPDNGNCAAEVGVEINDKLLGAVSDYIANLAIPTPGDHQGDPALAAGRAQFDDLGCGQCHRPYLSADLPGRGSVEFQAFTDLLLHDMGPGLADTIAAFAAEGAEWRTAPLWGLGLRTREADNTRLLHDGRAGSIHEAILWHDGEAQRSRQRYQALTDTQQHILQQFLQAL